MTTEDTFTIAITLKNGQCFEHQHPREPQPKVRKFIMALRDDMTHQRRGILTLPFPLGIYRMEDICSILFLDIETVDNMLPLGFHPSKPKG